MLSYQQMMERIAELMLVERPVLALRAGGGSLGPRIAAAVAGEDPELVSALMESLAGRSAARGRSRRRARAGAPACFDSAVEHALGEWERLEPLAAH